MNNITMHDEKNYFVLLVEDQNDMAMLATLYLQKAGYRVKRVKDGAEALEQLQSSADLPDLILLDALMPVMDGFEFLRNIANTALYNSIPVILMTALEDDDDQLRELTRPRLEIHHKPIAPEALLHQIARLIAI